jgi:hypothetical protein
MLAPASQFKLASLAALAGWLMLVLLPGWANTETAVLATSVLLLIGIYAWVLRSALTGKAEPGDDRPGFFTLRGVLALMRNPTAALACWVHILVFDLMVGVYIRQEGALAGISHGWLLPCYVLTLMFGPLGLLSFLLLRLVMAG